MPGSGLRRRDTMTAICEVPVRRNPPKKADCEPGGAPGGCTSAFGVQAVNCKTKSDDEDIGECGS